MDEKVKVLEENFNEYFELAEQSFQSKKYNSATTLFFKAICTLVDLFILKKEGFTPSSHTDRFRIVQEKYPEIYSIIDRDFPFYQDSYTRKITNEAVGMLREDVRRIKKMLER